jgi:tRNA G18 (ribose-2'-O)-methylase SpoU
MVITSPLETEPWAPTYRMEFPPIEPLLDSIRSAWNVGAIFRTADGFGIKKLHLCGITPTPATADLRKTALGAEKTIPWTYGRNSLQAGKDLKKAGYLLWALECDSRAIPISEIKMPEIGSLRNRGVILIVGNEETGVDPDLLALCDEIIYLPMRGTKRSFNVAVVFGITLHFLCFLLQQNESSRNIEHTPNT